MATQKAAAAATAGVRAKDIPELSGLPAAWGDAEVLPGVDLKDKAELIGVPFLVTGVKCTIGARDIAYVYVEAEDADGTRFMFNDSSTGIRATVDQLLADKGLGGTMDEWIDVRFVAPRGLRVSSFEVTDERGRTKTAKTYYLTTTGTRA